MDEIEMDEEVYEDSYAAPNEEKMETNQWSVDMAEDSPYYKKHKRYQHDAVAEMEEPMYEIELDESGEHTHDPGNYW